MSTAQTPNIDELEAETAGLPTDQILVWAVRRFDPAAIVITTAFGLEGCVLLDLCARLDRSLTVVSIDTDLGFPETALLRTELTLRYPMLRFVTRRAALTPEEQAARLGPALWSRDPDACCAARKVAPLRAALAGKAAWITSVTRSQSPTRAATRAVRWDDEFGIVKIAPLADWDRARTWDYVRRHRLPHSPLHYRGYPTIGCRPCTVPVTGIPIDGYSRAGRWAGTDKTECGLHGPRPHREDSHP